MKQAVALLWTVFAAIEPVAVAKAQAVPGCIQVVQNLNDFAARIDQNATTYWGYRTEFVDLIFGNSSSIVPNPMQAAEQIRAQGDALRAAMPGTLANFKGLVAMARSQSCLSPTQVSAILEPTIKLAKRVNFDQFPQEFPPQSTVQIGPPEMPH